MKHLAMDSWQTSKSGAGRGSIMSLMVIDGHWLFDRCWGKSKYAVGSPVGKIDMEVRKNRNGLNDY